MVDGGSRAEVEDGAFMSLYRRFRPGRFAELRGQPHVVRALQSAVRDGHVSHAYLFSGPRGTGKTSTARILARSLNCDSPLDGEPCGACASCLEIARGTSLDVHELDAASNNGVDAMRDLVAHAALGTPGRWKVYIVDEVHMLSNAAANALLKTLEEPPGHVVFVLATTDPQKVLPTIRSRTQHLEFRLLGAETLEELLQGVRELAGLEVDDATLDAAVRRGRGSARDALSALDQFVASGSAGDARPEVAEVVQALCDEDASRALVIVASLHEAGWGSQQLAAEVVDELRQMFLMALAPELADAGGRERERLAQLGERMGLPRVVRAMEVIGRTQVDMRDTPDPRVLLEVGLVRLARPQLDDSVGALAERVARLERALTGRSTGGSTAVGLPPPAAPAPASGEGDPGPGTAHPAPAGSAPAAVHPAPAAEVPGDPRSRPALGALRQPRSAAPSSGPLSPPASAPVPDPTPHGSSPPDPSRSTSPPQQDAAGDGPPAATGHVSATGGTGGDPSTPPPDRDALVEAWGDHVLRGLPARARALFGAGRFVAVEGGRAHFALPNAAHRDRCEEVRPTVEQALGVHFGSMVPLVLVVDGDPPPPRGPMDDRQGGPGTGGPPAPRSGPSVGGEVLQEPAEGVGDVAVGDEGDDEDLAAFDHAELGDEAVESIAQARLLEAFPGAEEVRD